MVKRNKSETASAAVTASRGGDEYDIKDRKKEMARIADEADAKEAETVTSAENDVGDRVDPGSTDTSMGGNPMTDLGNSGDDTLNPFDPASLRLDQSFADTVRTKKLLTTVPVRRPNRQDYVRVHPEPACRLTPAATIEVSDDREVYLLTPQMAQVLPGEYSLVTLYLAVNRQGVPFIWPVKLPSSDGKHNEWNRSAAEAAERAMKKWVRIASNMSLRAYETFEAIGDIPEPIWPDLPFEKILKIAFRERLVDRPDHPLVQRLQGR